jgi:NTE family protein
MKKIGIALGAGGAKGLAHVLILEALDELALKPS